MAKYASLGFIMLVLLAACSSTDKERPASWVGEWQATWETDPSSFEGIDGITDFQMPGRVTFDGEKVNILAFGFPGCAFSSDTLDHSLYWKVKGDSLILINDEDTPGMVYLINEVAEDQIKLQLMEDIFLTLKK